MKASEDRKRYDEEMLDFRKLHDQGLADIIYGEEREEVNGGEPSAADVIVNEQILDSIEQDEKKEKNDIILEEAESEQAEESRNIVGSGGYGEAIEDEANEAANESANGSEDK